MLATKLTLFAVSKDERDPTEGTGMAKGTSQAEATSNSKKIKPLAFACLKASGS